ncbi:T9SS type A sorting domain-containing protein [Ferruginibacter sp. HRS2-29]|uniref:T9SS type A sorting domain-containing protein n=1 Tax=Ferruginibacter sp. HRS2-29 TaxID=2487334 RepID=UPI0020CC5764|nr:T9SS type A sorting domain-containing protein [Ferruginibacter sp. HRS2-29]
MQGTKFWAGEDIDFGTTCTNASGSANQQVTWSGIDISGKSVLSFKGLFAANSSFASNWEGTIFGASQDYISVEYRIDGGAWTKAVAFYASSTSQSQTLKLETTGDLVGDGADLTYAFTEYGANIAGTGSLLDLRLNVFANGSGTEEIAADNFRLFYGSILPVKLISFSGSNKHAVNSLQWQTATEANSRHFEIERSADGVNFETLGTVAANGSSNSIKSYSFVDTKPLRGVNYYRLKQADMDNNFEFSKVITVKNSTGVSIAVYPNPLSDQLFLNGLDDKNITYRITNTLGQTVQQGTTGLSNRIGITNLHKGVYYIQVEQQAIKFIKQ